MLEQLRWGGAPPRCPRCSVAGRCRFLRPAEGTTQLTRTGAPTPRRVWRCGACRGQFSVLTGTVLEGTRIAVSTWVGVMSDAAEGRSWSDPAALADRYGISREAAQHMIGRLRLAFAAPPVAGLPVALPG